MRSSRVAVVGAGPSGLAATKELRQEGFVVTCFERGDGVGGVFRFHADTAQVSVWRSCRMTSSALVTSFSDHFPHWQASVPFEHRHLAHHEYLHYLESYVEAFGLASSLRFGSEGDSVSRTAEGTWRLTVRDMDSDSLEVGEFDAVAICSGVHGRPRIPPVPGIEGFRGELLHAAHYRGPESVTGRSIVFIGGGESAGEIVAELCRTRHRCYLSLRRGVFVLPRLLNGLPNDYTGTRLLYSLPDFVSRRTDRQARSTKRFLALILCPLFVVRTALDALDRLFRRRKGVQSCSPEIERLIARLRSEAEGNQFETFATKTDAFLDAVADGRCELRPGLAEVSADGVVFDDGSAVRADSIVLCTGFEEAALPFLDDQVDLTRLYKSCFAPELGASIAFIGFVRPPLGAIPPMAEMQARWYARILSGSCVLPAPSSMRKVANEEVAARRRVHRRVIDRLPHLVDYSTYMDDIADEIGCKPVFRELIRSPRLLWKIYTMPFSGVQYRLRGPRPTPKMAVAVIMHAPSHVRLVRLLDLAFSVLACGVGMRRLGPQLSMRPKTPEGRGHQGQARHPHQTCVSAPSVNTQS